MKDSMGRVIALVFLVLIIGSLLLTTVAPALTGLQDSSSPPTQQPQAAEPTLAPVTFPTPDPSGPMVAVASIHIHPSAVFYVAHPQGFSATPTTQHNIASVSLVDPQRYSVVHAYVQQYDAPQSVSDLDAENTPGVSAASWSEYDNWVETGRGIRDDRLVIDFELTLGQNTYLARHITWPAAEEPTWVYILRLVVPGNYTALLDELEARIIPSYHLLPDSLSVPLAWPAVVDPTSGYTIRYPDTWQYIDGGWGRITTLSGSEATLTLSGSDEQITEEMAAQEWVMAARPGAEVLAVNAIERAYGAGFAVAYGFADADGEPHSGLALLLNGADRRLVSASLRLPAGGVNLLEDTDEAYTEVRSMLGTFAVLPAGAMSVSTE